MKNDIEVIAVVKTASNHGFSHVYIDFYSLAPYEVDEYVAENKMVWGNMGDPYNYLNLNNQYGGMTNEGNPNPYGYKLSATLNEANPYELSRAAKLLRRVDNRTNKLLSVDGKEYADPYLNYVAKAFKAMKVKRAILIENNTVKWNECAMDAVEYADGKIRFILSK